LIQRSHIFRSSKHKRDKLCRCTEELIYVLSYEVHFSLLLIEKDSAGALDIIIGVTYFSNNEIEKDNCHSENVDEPEGPNNSRCKCTKHEASTFVLTGPRINVHGRDVSNRVSEDLYEHPKGWIHVFILFALHIGIHDKVNHGKNINVEHKNCHERVEVFENLGEHLYEETELLLILDVL